MTTEEAKWIELVSKDGMLLKQVPKAGKRPSVYEAAVAECGAALKLVPKKSRTLRVCSAAVQSKKRDPNVLDNVPEQWYGYCACEQALLSARKSGECIAKALGLPLNAAEPLRAPRARARRRPRVSRSVKGSKRRRLNTDTDTEEPPSKM